MKVLHILRMSTYSGAENVACQIINMCTERGIESVYAAPDGAIRNAVEEKGIQFLGLKRISISEIKRAIKETSPDVIHAHDMYVSFLVSLCCGKIPMISHIHNNDLGSRKITLKSVLYLFSSYRAKCIFWVSPSAFEGYHFKEKIKDKSCVLKNIIDIDDVCLKADSDKEFYDYDICFIGRLVSPKDPLRLMRVFSKVCQKVPNVKIKKLKIRISLPSFKYLIIKTNRNNQAVVCIAEAKAIRAKAVISQAILRFLIRSKAIKHIQQAIDCLIPVRKNCQGPTLIYTITPKNTLLALR